MAVRCQRPHSLSQRVDRRTQRTLRRSRLPKEILIEPRIVLTLAIIKPDAVAATCEGEIISRILSDGVLKIVGMKKLRMSLDVARQFYDVHRNEPFFGDLITFMSSGPVVVVALSGDRSVARWREWMVPLRAEYGTTTNHNAVHGSDSEDNGNAEVSFFFSKFELLQVNL